MKTCRIAVDLGASSGRLIAGRLEKNTLKTEELYRFDNRMDVSDGSLVWDTRRLFGEIVKGLKAAKAAGLSPLSLSIDTWGVDYVLLGEDDEPLGKTYAYRDSRTAAAEPAVSKVLSPSDLYARTGIQKQPFNTIYQLTADRLLSPGKLEKAKTFLMMPDYLQFLLTGNKLSEYTNATTTQLVSPATCSWDGELLSLLGIPEKLFLPLSFPGEKAGSLRPSLAKEVGFDCDVLLCPGHDTASAVLAFPDPTGEGLYLSSGTWSLMGIETKNAILSEESRLCNFTNEGGYGRRFRFLKNIMGLWMIQSVRRELGEKYSFAALCDLAASSRVGSLVDVNDATFLSPSSMTEAVQKACEKSGQQIPRSPGDLARVIYRSLALCYAKTVSQIESITNRRFSTLSVIGG